MNAITTEQELELLAKIRVELEVLKTSHAGKDWLEVQYDAAISAVSELISHQVRWSLTE